MAYRGTERGPQRRTDNSTNDCMTHRHSQNLTLSVSGHALEVQRIAANIVAHENVPELVFLHEGLGSVSHWKTFPAEVAHATGCGVTVYSRYGSGNSDLLTEPHPVTYMHDEALHALPDLLAQLNIRNPILVGHSDGASIAIIFAGSKQAGSTPAASKRAGVQTGVRGLVLLAPHVFVEDLSVASIAEAKTKFEGTDLAEKLGRHHRDAARTFWGWNNIWLHPDFRRWNIEEYLPRITCPILAIQGLDDQYGTIAQVEAIKRQSGGPVEVLALPECRHSVHRDQHDAVLEAIARFVGANGGNNSPEPPV
jgi:pimeloyl-ACP methyl ester carboxylesterase